MSDDLVYCRYHEYSCDNKIPAELEGELCESCDAEYKAIAASYERQYRASKSHLSKDEVLDAYSDPADYQKRARMERDY